MPTGKTPSKADQWLIQQLAKAGFPRVSPRTLESWRSEGLLPAPTRSWLGKGCGSTSAYPPSAAREAIKLASVLQRHRSFDKAAALLYLHGYFVEPERIRRSLLSGLDYMDAKVTSVAGEETDPTKVADAMAQAFISERLRTKAERDFRKQQIREAGGPEQLERAYRSLFRMYFGAPSVGGFLGFYRTIGQNFRDALGLDQQEFQQFELRLDDGMTELTREGGFSQILRTVVESAPPSGFVGLRRFMREVRAWVASLGLTFSPPGFYGDANEALLRPDIEEDAEETGATEPPVDP